MARSKFDSIAAAPFYPSQFDDLLMAKDDIEKCGKSLAAVTWKPGMGPK
jgi:hypothetical protein